MPRVGHFLAPTIRHLPAQLLYWRQPQSFAQLVCTLHHRLSLCSRSAHLQQYTICGQQDVTLLNLSWRAGVVHSHVACIAISGCALRAALDTHLVCRTMEVSKAVINLVVLTFRPGGAL